MQELIEKLGVDWKLLAAQAANFLIILAVLRLTLYKPLIRVLRERREKIERGLRDAEAASTRLGEVEAVGRARLAEVEREAVRVIENAEVAGRRKEVELLATAKVREAEVLANAARLAEARKREVEEKVLGEAQSLVRSAVAKVADLAPDAFDDALIREAVQAAKKAK